MGKKVDLTNQVFGRLTVISLASWDNGVKRYLCKCLCGETKVVHHSNLRNGSVASCGCLRRENSVKMRLKHGGYYTIEYKAWAAMLGRCFNPKNPRYARYGGRGIGVCDRWRHSFENFLKDMGKRTGSRFSVERKNNEAGYSPENCVWADDVTQANNRSDTRRITFNAETRTIRDWSGRVGIPTHIVRGRLDRGWTVERALSERHIIR